MFIILNYQGKEEETILTFHLTTIVSEAILSRIQMTTNVVDVEKEKPFIICTPWCVYKQFH